MMPIHNTMLFFITASGDRSVVFLWNLNVLWLCSSQFRWRQLLGTFKMTSHVVHGLIKSTAKDS